MYLGIDLGTSSVKVILMDEQQQVIDSSSAALTVSRPQPLWSEQDPNSWWKALNVAIQSLQQLHEKPFSMIKGIGLSGQMHGATLLDKENNPLRPAILWNDGRSFDECKLLKERVPNAEEITANLLFPGFTAPKLLWVKKHEPEIFKQVKKVLLPKDYLRLKICGNFATDMSDASGTSWLNVKKRCWSDEMIHASDLSQDQMPELFEGSDITGTVLAEIAQNWGIPKDTIVVGGGGDNAASAISMAVINKGQAFLSLGTSGVYFVADDDYHPNPERAMHTMCHCLPQRWHAMNVHLSSASCMNWFAADIARCQLDSMLDELVAQWSDEPPLFLPYLSGERSPHNNPHAKGVFFGMTYNTKRETLLQSILEGTAFAIAEGQQIMLDAGVEIDNVMVVGGGARSELWGKVLASALNRPLTYRHDADVGGAYGAARLAWLAKNGGDPDDVFTLPEIDHVIEPDSQWVDAYAERLEKFKQLYTAVKVLF